MGQTIAEFMQLADLDRPVDRTDHALNVAMSCCACGSSLTFDEMHYLAHGDGKASCCACEEKWSVEVAAWRAGAPGEFPSRPGRNDKYPEN